MGLFNDLGRRVERFKQSAVEAAEAGADYECRACEARFHTDREECPECGASAVVPTEDEADGGPSAGAEAEGGQSSGDEAERGRPAGGEEHARPADGEQQGRPADEAESGPTPDEPE